MLFRYAAVYSALALLTSAQDDQAAQSDMAALPTDVTPAQVSIPSYSTTAPH